MHCEWQSPGNLSGTAPSYSMNGGISLAPSLSGLPPRLTVVESGIFKTPADIPWPGFFLRDVDNDGKQNLPPAIRSYKAISVFVGQASFRFR